VDQQIDPVSQLQHLMGDGVEPGRCLVVADVGHAQAAQLEAVTIGPALVRHGPDQNLGIAHGELLVLHGDGPVAVARPPRWTKLEGAVHIHPNTVGPQGRRGGETLDMAGVHVGDQDVDA